VSYQRIVISSGHGKYVRGASGILDEVDEARRVVGQVADELRDRGVDVKVFHDDTSHSQNENLNTIVDYHNAQERDLDVSVHFNAYEQVSKPMGVEVLYVTQSALAGEVSAAIADCGFLDRGAKKRTDLFFLNSTEMPSILIETCFVDSEADAEVYHNQFAAICDAIASILGPRPPAASPRVDIEVSGDVLIFVNGEPIE
jgi:N-acetylmuramoyl-L-alanine amidase